MMLDGISHTHLLDANERLREGEDKIGDEFTHIQVVNLSYVIESVIRIDWKGIKIVNIRRQKITGFELRRFQGKVGY